MIALGPLSFGGAPLGNLYTPVSDDVAAANRGGGVGARHPAMLARFARETDMDLLLLAGRYAARAGRARRPAARL